MTGTQKKFVVGGLVLAAALTYLCVTSIGAGQMYYVSVDQYLADPNIQDGKIRLNGTVGAEELTIDPNTRTLTFMLLGDSGKVQVQFSGVVPDLFQAGGKVVVVGRTDGEVFQAEKLLTQCASKYEMQEAGAEKSI